MIREDILKSARNQGDIVRMTTGFGDIKNNVDKRNVPAFKKLLDELPLSEKELAAALYTQIRLFTGLRKFRVVGCYPTDKVDETSMNINDLQSRPLEEVTRLLAGMIAQAGQLFESAYVELPDKFVVRKRKEAAKKTTEPEIPFVESTYLFAK